MITEEILEGEVVENNHKNDYPIKGLTIILFKINFDKMGTDNNTPTPEPKETSIWTIIGGFGIFFRILYWLIHSYNSVF